MDYEKKYKEALDLMKSLYPTLEGGKKEEAERVFPELKEAKEAKEAKIIRAIARVLDENYMDAAVIEGVEIAEIKSWLEDTKMNINANEVIEWLQSYGIAIPTLIKSFKNRFNL